MSKKPPITTKGHATLQNEHIGATPGKQELGEQLPLGRVETSAARRLRKISDVFGVLKQEKGPRLTVEEINEAAAKGWAGET